MVLVPVAHRILALLVFLLVGHPLGGSSATKDDIAAAAVWFDGLTWPDLRGKPYVEVTFRQADQPGDEGFETHVQGFLLSEDDSSLTVFCDGTDSAQAWPYAVERIQKRTSLGEVERTVTHRVVALDETVNDLLAKLRRPRPEPKGRTRLLDFKTHDQTFSQAEVFSLARCCAWQGRPDLADQLDQQLMTANPWILGPRRETQNLGFRAGIEEEVAYHLMWKAVADFGRPTVTRTELLVQFERIVHDFPASEHRERAAGFVEMLRRMIAEDEAHARTVRPIEEMTVDEKIDELIFRLRDQNGHQDGWPGDVDVFAVEGGDSPAERLYEMKHAAVPALLEALSDERLSRSVGSWRPVLYSHFVLTVGDCAEAILSAIVGRRFWNPRTTSSAMQKDGDLETTRAAAEAWWNEVKANGEELTLITGVCGGGDDSVEQANRLAEINPIVALHSITAGILAAKSEWVQAGLVKALAGLDGVDATAALLHEMRNCSSRRGRVTAAFALVGRGNREAVPAMIGIWTGWKPSEQGWDDDKECAGPMIGFLLTCNDVAGAKAIADRFSSLPAGVRIRILQEIELDRGRPLPPGDRRRLGRAGGCGAG